MIFQSGPKKTQKKEEAPADAGPVNPGKNKKHKKSGLASLKRKYDSVKAELASVQTELKKAQGSLNHMVS